MQLNPIIVELFQAFGIDCRFHEGLVFYGVNGMYIPEPDTILISPCEPSHNQTHDIILLHELIHWTGHSKRLKRYVIVNAEKQIESNAKNKANEEVIAQWGMYYLGMYLGLDQEVLELSLDSYISQFEKYDMEYCEKEAQKAVKFIINKIEQIADKSNAA